MADTTTPTTQTAGTDVNLNLNFDDIKIPEAPTTATNLNIDFSDVAKPEVKAETPEVKLEAPETTTYTEALPAEEVKPVVIEETAPVVEELKPVVVEETPAPVIEEVKPVVEETPAPAAKDDRLAQEDKIVEKTETPVVEEVSVTPEKTAEIATKELPTSSLAEDQKIIDELTSTPTVGEVKPVIVEEATPVIEEATPVIEEVKPVAVEEIKPVVVASAVAMDLDSLLGTPSTPATNEVIATPVINQIPVEAIPQTMPGSTFQTGMPTMVNPIITPTIQMTNTAPTMATNMMPKRKKSSGIKTFAIFAALAGAAAYVLATMYPLEYQGMKANVMSIFGGSTTITESTGGLENMLTSTGEMAETGLLLTGGNETPTTGDLSTSGFNAFEDLENILTGTNNNALLTDQQLTQLKKYSAEAKTFLELGNKINDPIMRKYGTYISVKADGLILSIENKEQIDNAKIDGYLAQFSGYLHQLTTLSYDDINTPSQPAVNAEEANTPTSGEDNASGMIQDINRDSSGTTTHPLPEIPALPSGATQVPSIPGF